MGGRQLGIVYSVHLLGVHCWYVRRQKGDLANRTLDSNLIEYCLPNETTW